MKLQFSAQFSEPRGDTWEIIAMQEGEIEGRGQVIGAEALNASLPAFDKVWVQNLVFDGGHQNHLSGDIRKDYPEGVLMGNVVGLADSPRTEVIPETGNTGIVATFHAANDTLKQILLEAREAGMLEKIGLSINGSTARENLQERILDEGRKVLEILKIDSIDSIDLVTRPGAGGYFRALLASASASAVTHAPAPQQGGNTMIVTTLKTLLDAKGIPYTDGSPLNILASVQDEGQSPEDKNLFTSLKTLLSDGHDDAAEAMMTSILAAIPEEDEDPKEPEEPPEDEEDEEDEDDKKVQASKMNELDRLLSKARVKEALDAEKTLPGSVKTLLASKFEGRIVTAAEIHKEIAMQKQILASVSNSGKPRSLGAGGVAVGYDSIEKAQSALDALFGLQASDGIAPFRSLRQAYGFFTGDAERVDGVFRLQASSFTASTFTNAMGNTLNRRLVKDYESKMQLWRPFTYIIPGGFQNFKTQEEVQIGGIGELSTVADDGQYTDVTVSTDNKETWTPFTKGNLLVITRRMIINDDIGAVDRLIKKLARAAHYTLQKFVFKLLIGWDTAINDKTMSDSVVIYHASHGNLQTGAISHTNLIALNDLINAQVELTSSIPLDLELAGVVIPKELKETTLVAVESEGKPGTANNDINILQANNMQVIIVDKSYLGADANNYYGFADPNDYPGIYLGFFQGRETPELITQDQPGAGQVFDYDRLRWKIRFEFGGVVADYRPIAAGIVA